MPRRVLVVEDDERSRRLLTDVLAWHGYEVEAAESGEEALRATALRPADAALLDIQLPGMDGFALLAALRSRGGRLPAIAVTASVMDSDRVRILAAGFDACLGKPVNIRELAATLQSLLAEVAP